MVFLIAIIAVYLAICVGLYYKVDLYEITTKNKEIVIILPFLFVIILCYTICKAFRSREQRKVFRLMILHSSMTILMIYLSLMKFIKNSADDKEIKKIRILENSKKAIKETNEIIRPNLIDAFTD